MSNYYRIHCLDCEEDDYESRYNRGYDGQVDVIKNRGLLILTQVINVWPLEIVITSNGQPIDIPFLQKHLDHRLVSVSEYRDHWFDENGKRHEA